MFAANRSNDLFAKVVLDIALFVVFTIVTVVVYYMFMSPAKQQAQIEKAARIAHAKRLFGSAWKDSMRLDDE